MNKYTCGFYLALFGALTPGSSYSYSVARTDDGAEIRWAGRGVGYYINTSYGPSGVSSALLSAMTTWSAAPGKTFQFSYSGTTSRTGSIDDDKNVLSFGYLGADGTIAQNSYWFSGDTGLLTDSDVVFNTYYGWSTSGEAGKMDVQNIAAHELGHSLSLDDLYGAADVEKTMYGYASRGETRKRTLEADDIAGIAHLYPLTNAGMSPAGGHVIATRRPTFSWAATMGATWYYVWINRNGQIYLKQWVDGTTQWTPPSDLPGGNYTWWIQAWGPYTSSGAWSGGATFTIPSNVPGTVGLVSPSGVQSYGGALTYTWNADPFATYYQLWINKGGSKWYSTWYNTGWRSGQISQTVSGHPPGCNYTWWVQGWSPDGYGLWSAAMAFTTPGGSYGEDFNDGLAQGWIPDSSSWTIENGWYKAYNPNPPQEMALVSRSGTVFLDGSFQVDVWKGSSDYYARYLLFRCSADFAHGSSDSQFAGSSYAFGVDGTDYFVFKVVSGSFVMIKDWTSSSYAHGAGQKDTLTAVARGTRIDLYINGGFVYGFNDASITSGRVGCFGYTGPANRDTLWFDNVIVTP